MYLFHVISDENKAFKLINISADIVVFLNHIKSHISTFSPIYLMLIKG